MFFTDLAFDPVRDIAPVDQFGFIDLKTALATGIVPSQLPDSVSDYNGIDNPDAILGKPRDIFEAMDAQKEYEAAASVASESNIESQ